MAEIIDKNTWPRREAPLRHSLTAAPAPPHAWEPKR